MGKYSTEGNADYRQSSGYRHGNNDEKICGDCIKLDTSEPIFKNNEIKYKCTQYDNCLVPYNDHACSIIKPIEPRAI